MRSRSCGQKPSLNHFGQALIEFSISALIFSVGALTSLRILKGALENQICAQETFLRTRAALERDPPNGSRGAHRFIVQVLRDRSGAEAIQGTYFCQRRRFERVRLRQIHSSDSEWMDPSVFPSFFSLDSSGAADSEF